MEEYKAEGTDFSISVMRLINLSAALPYCGGWRCTEDCAALLYTCGRGVDGFAFTGGPGTLPGKCKVFFLHPTCVLRMQPEPWLAVPSAPSLENPEGTLLQQPLVSAAASPRLLPGQLPQFRACLPRARHMWDEHEGHQQFPSALVGNIWSINMARTHYTHDYVLF